MGNARFIVGDVFDVLATIPDASVDLILTSPPFLALRSYLLADHPDKAKEIGSEATPGEFLDVLLDLTEEWRRVLAPHGSICVELGDTYSGSATAVMAPNDRPQDGGYASSERVVYDGFRAGIRNMNDKRQGGGPGWPLDKSLCLIPELYRISLVYGFNPLTGRTTPRWRARNVVRWCRPNPPVGALADKVRPATSDMVVACTDRRRYFDLDAVRTPSDYDRPNLRGKGSRRPGELVPGQKHNGSDHTVNPAGAPPLDHWWHDDDTFDQDAWLISTQPYKGSHYATWPEALCVTPIEAMCPRKVCTVCGKPSERIVGETTYTRDGVTIAEISEWPWGGEVRGKSRQGRGDDYRLTRQAETVGWTDCGHDVWRNGIVLDPFAGSGTTLAVAVGHGRDAIGIDLDERNTWLARERVGMWLTIENAKSGVTPL